MAPVPAATSAVCRRWNGGAKQGAAATAQALDTAHTPAITPALCSARVLWPAR